MATSGTVLSKSKSVRRLILNHGLIHIKKCYILLWFVTNLWSVTSVSILLLATQQGSSRLAHGAKFVLCRSHACVGLALLCSCSTCHSLLHQLAQLLRSSCWSLTQSKHVSEGISEGDLKSSVGTQRTHVMHRLELVQYSCYPNPRERGLRIH